MKEIYTVYKDTRNMSRAEWLTARKAGRDHRFESVLITAHGLGG